MNINPVSFGRAIKVNATVDSAKMISDAANVKYPSTGLHRFAKSIFDDTNISPATVVELSSGEVYIFSGEEAKKQRAIFSDANKKIKENNDLVKMIPLWDVRQKRKLQVDVENYRIQHNANYKTRSLVEDGINCKPKSTLDIAIRTVKSQFFGEYEEVSSATYTSNRNGKKETFKYEV
ncbi:MAG: hypothetical protein IJY61_04700 [Candidatus Gastranaerophilales bacterium]|nr:hypothetical protein [Candidatus Gastranaerophilales bacterium]